MNPTDRTGPGGQQKVKQDGARGVTDRWLCSFRAGVNLVFRIGTGRSETITIETVSTAPVCRSKPAATARPHRSEELQRCPGRGQSRAMILVRC